MHDSEMQIDDYVEYGWHIQCQGQCRRVLSSPRQMDRQQFIKYATQLKWRITRKGGLLCSECKQVTKR